MSTESAIAEVMPGKLNALVKNIMRQTGETDANEAVRLINSGEWVLTKVAQAIKNILESVGTIVVSATTGTFIAREKFVVGTDRKTRVKINHISNDFTEWFLSGGGKIEDPIGEQTLRYQALKQSSIDSPIIAELGGEPKVETTLTEVFSLMEKQPNGEEGVLLNNGWANIFYVRDKNNILRTMHMYWYGGWNAHAYSVEDPITWRDGYRAFSRNSVLESSVTVSTQV